MLSAISKIVGPNNFLALCVLPSRAKEDSGADAVEEEYQLSKKMASAGFLAHARVYQDCLQDSAL